ncbi:MAG: hypothetical protein WCX65_02155 [bacterium]
MRKNGFAFLCLLMLAMVAVIAPGCAGKKKAAEKFETYTSAADLFSVDVPEGYTNFETQTQDHDTPNGTVTTTLYQSASNEMIFMVSATPIQADAKNAPAALEKGREAVGKQGTVISKGETKLDGQPALSLRYKMVSSGIDVFFDAAFAYIDGIQYQVVFGSPKEDKLSAPEAKRFFESFKHFKKGEAPAGSAPAAPAETKSSGKTAGDGTFKALCDKLVAETKKTVGAAYTDQMGEQTKSGCAAAEEAYKATPKAKEAINAFVNHIMTACAGKSGQEWISCYSAQAPAAGKAASDAMMK